MTQPDPDRSTAPEGDASPPPPGPVSRTFLSLRTPIHYLDWGNTAAPTVILLHGGRDHARSWDHVAAALRADWHVIAPDLRGHGDSGWSLDGTYSVAALVCDLAGMVRETKRESVSIVAHSLGAMTALRYASLFPERVRRLVAIEGTGVMSRVSGDIAARWRTWIEAKQDEGADRQKHYASLDDALVRMRAANPNLSEERARHLTRHAVRRHDDGSYTWKYDPAARRFLPLDLSPQDEVALLQAIRCPVLLMWGMQSWASDPTTDGTAAQIADCKVLKIDGAGHWPHHDQEDLVTREAARFLAEPA